MIRKLMVAAGVAAVLGMAATTAGGYSIAKPEWCHGGKGYLCNAAGNALSSRLLDGSRPYEDAWESGKASLVRIPSSEDPDCYAFQTTGPATCFAFYSYRHVYYFISGEVTQGQAAHRTAEIMSVASYRRRWADCSLRIPGLSTPPGRLISNNNCGRGEPENEPYYVDDEMSGASGHVRFTREVGWQFTDSASVSTAFFRAVGAYRCSNGVSTITCRDGAGDEFKYIR
jgi:hypothetical protein